MIYCNKIYIISICDFKVFFFKIVCFIDIFFVCFFLNLNMNKNVIIKYFYGYYDNVNCKICFFNI